MRATTFDLAAFSAGGENLLATVKAVRYRVETETADARPIKRSASSAQPTKRRAVIETTQTSILTTPLRVSHLEVSALTAGGENWRALVRRGWFRADFRHAEGSAVGDFWRWPVLVERDFRARFDLMTPTDGVPGLATGESFESDGRRRISLWVRQEGELREYRSFDGRAFA
jgi:hypothetical protein